MNPLFLPPLYFSQGLEPFFRIITRAVSFIVHEKYLKNLQIGVMDNKERANSSSYFSQMQIEIIWSVYIYHDE